MNPEEQTTEPTTEQTEPITEPTEPVDYTGSYDSQMVDLLTSIDSTLKHIDSYFGLIHDAVRVILAYGLILVPLIIVCWMLWWFFSQFLHKY